MTSARRTKQASFLLAVGAVLLWGAMASFYVEQRFTRGAGLLLIVGLCCWGGCFFIGRSSQASLSARFQWKKKGARFLAVIGCVLFFAAVNYLAFNTPFRWDLTRARQHTLSPTTISFVEHLKNPVEITAFYAGVPPKYLEDMLKEYERVSGGMVQTEIIDPVVQIGYAAQFGRVIKGDEKKVIVRRGRERRDIDFTRAPLTEEQLTNAIIRVSRKQKKVYFLTGHGEFSINDTSDQGLSQLARILQTNNILSQELMLATQKDIPQDCDVLIVAGPRQPLTEEEESMIQDYLRQGGDALFLVEHVVVTTPDRPLTEEEKNKNPSLNNILHAWGVHVKDDIVVDLTSHAGSDVGSPATRHYRDHKAITQGLDYTFYVRPRSIVPLSDRRSTVKVAPVVLTASAQNSWGETNRTLQVKFDEGIDTPGPVAISFVIWEKKEENDLSDTRLIVFTDADFLTNAYINHYSNAQMGLNVINWLAELDYKAFLGPQDIQVERLDLTSRQKRQVASILVLMPLLIAITGIVVWMRS